MTTKRTNIRSLMLIVLIGACGLGVIGLVARAAHRDGVAAKERISVETAERSTTGRAMLSQQRDRLRRQVEADQQSRTKDFADKIGK